ncbi:hypothetical protein ASG87_18845 [Frateuria sp. Soil773]|nr:hypothetical protein ASG87_18845 [Frateuria sp. Soil773]
MPSFWRHQAEGKVATRHLSPEELRASGVSEAKIHDPNYVPVEAALADFDCFDAEFFGVAPRDAVMMDPQHRLALEHAYWALENAGYRPRSVPHSTGLFLGIGYNNYMLHYVQYASAGQDANGELAVLLGNDKSYAATRIAHRLNLRGPCMAVDTACSTSLVAVHQACAALLAQECDMALAGGARVLLPPGQGYSYVEGGVYARDGLCAPFDARAAGTLQGSGVGMVVLRRLEDALADGDPIRALIRASAINNDGAAKIDYAAPSVAGQAEVIEAALALADIDPATIAYVETHGTGTALGDPIEFAALQRAFKRSRTTRRDRCYLGGVKANIGHLDAAAGVAGLINAIGVLEQRRVPPMANFQHINPRIDLEQSAFSVPTEAVPLATEAGHACLAAVSSFGIGGTNAHVLLESAPAPEPTKRSRRYQLLPLSARSPDALAQLARSVGAAIATQVDLDAVAQTLQHGRDLHVWRGVLVSDDPGAAGQRWIHDTQAWLAESVDATTPPTSIAFQFPGQGTLPVAVAAPLYGAFPGFAEALDDALSDAPAGVRERLLDTGVVAGADDEVEQVALVVFQYALAKTLMGMGLRPTTVLGHSLGEYVAAAVAGVFDLQTLIRLVSARGRAMAKMPVGGMLSLALPEVRVRELLARHRDLDLAAINTGDQCVLAGSSDALAALEHEAAERAWVCKRLNVQRAFHSRQTEAVLPEFAKAFADLHLNAPKCELISNVLGDVVNQELTQPEYWLRHLRSPVQYGRGIERLRQRQGVVLIEVGAGQVLTALAKAQGLPARQVFPLLPQDARGGEFALLKSLGGLWQLGLPMDLGELDGRVRRRRVPLPGYPFARKRHWLDLVPEDWQSAPAWKEGGMAHPHHEETGVPDPSDSRPSGPILSASVWQRDASIGLESAASMEPDRLIVHGDAESILAGRLGEALQACAVRLDRLQDALADRSPGAAQLLPLQVLYVFPKSAAGSMLQADLPDRLESALVDLFRVARLCSDSGERIQLRLLSTAAMDVLGDGRVNALHAALAASARSLGLEHPELDIRLLDLPDDDGDTDLSLDVLPRMLAEGGDVTERAIRFGRAWKEEFQLLPIRERKMAALRKGGRYLVLGGLGGVGRALVLALTEPAEARGAHLILVGRSQLPPQSEWAAILDAGGDPEACARIRCLQQLQARQVTFDVRIAGSGSIDLPGWMEFIGSCGPLHGVVHALGQPGEGVARTREQDAIRRVLRTKILPLLAVLNMAPSHVLDFVLLVSSLASAAGGPGQADYAAANAVLDTVARANGAAKWLAVSWDQWADTGMSQTSGGLRWWDRSCLPPSWTQATKAGQTRFRIQRERDWSLREHVLTGVPVLPGTAMIDLFLRGSGTSAIHDLQWLEAAVADAHGGIDAELRITPRGAETELELLRRRGNQPPQILASAWLCTGADAPPIHSTRDVEAIQGRLARTLAATPAAVRDVLPAYRSGVLQLGPRWQSIQSIHVGEGELLAELALPSEFEHDQTYVCVHPALLDCATGLLAACLLPEGAGAMIPASVREIRQFAPLPSRCWSWVRRNQDRHGHRFDIDLIAHSGEVVAYLHGFELRAVGGNRLPHANPAVAEMGQGLTPAQALAPLAALIETKQPAHVVVSLGRVMQRRADWRRLSMGAEARTAVGSVMVDGDDVSSLHRELAGLWAEQLGLTQVSLDDDFFQIGGNSLSAMQVVARLRERRGQQFEVRALFEHPTLRRFAEFVGITEESARAVTNLVPKGPELPDHPLSPQQQRLWFLAETEDDAATYNIPVVVRLRGLLDLGRLRRALVRVCERHQVLRLRWFRQEGELRQSLSALQGALPVIDLRGLSTEDRTYESQRLIAADARRGFSWLSEALHREALVCVDAEQHILMGCLHHAIADHWSVGNLLTDLSQAYDGKALPALARDYLDYAWYQHTDAVRALRADGLRFWRQALREAPELLELPLDHPRPARQSNQGARQEYRLPASLCARLERLALQQGASLYMVLLAAFKAMLSSLSGQTHLVIGTPVANRPESFEPCLGFFANTIAIATRFAADSRFIDVLAAVRSSALDAYAHQDVPFDEVVSAVVDKRRTAFAPLVQCLFVLQNAPGEAPAGGGLNMDVIDQSTHTAKFDLVLALYQDQAGIRCIVEYRRELFEASSVHALLDRYQRCLKTAIDDPECPIKELAGNDPGAKAPVSDLEEFVL